MRVILLMALVGCGGVNLEQTSPEVERVTVTDERIDMPVGLAVGVLLEDADAEDDTSRMTSHDEAMVGVGATATPHEYIVYAQKAGETAVEVYINDELKGEVEVGVVAY